MESTLSMNTLRIVLVGMAVLAAIIAFALAQWAAGIYLTAAVGVHGALWLYLGKQRDSEHAELHAGVETMLRDQG